MSLGVWTPPGSHNPPPEIKQIGELWMGRFGFFIPKQSIGEDMSTISYKFLQDNRSRLFQRFLFDARLKSDIKSLTEYVVCLWILV